MMDVIRRNTDYGLRMMAALAGNCGTGELMSASDLIRRGKISHEVGRKLLQKLREAKLVKAVRGSRGGYKLNRKASEISLKEIIRVLQGRVYLNACMRRGQRCEFKPRCGISAELTCLQKIMDEYLEDFTLDKIIR